MIPSPDQLLAQAERLASREAGAPRQVDLRRAISAAYYAMFHAILRTAADEVVGTSQRTSPLYELAYRSIDHARLRKLCEEAQQTTLSSRRARYVPTGSFTSDIRSFAASTLELQRHRHSADYDPSFRTTMSDAQVAIETARSGIARFDRASASEKRVFLFLLLFEPR